MQLLFILLPLLILAIAGVFLLFAIKHTPERTYKPKGPYLLSPGEARFFDALAHSTPTELYICPKVRIADLIETKRERSDPLFWKEQGPINQKHVDFVVCKRSDFAPVCAIELDGGSHHDQRRAARDLFVDSVFASANIPLLHIPVAGFYEYTSLRNQIIASIASKSKAV